MPYNIVATTAEAIIGATDAALQCPNGVNDQIVAEFLDIPVDNARNALLMAQELGLVENNNQVFTPKNPIATYLITSSQIQKASILRLVLEQYEPYRSFKSRLQLSDSVTVAANEIQAIYGMPAHKADISSTLVSLGTYTGSLISEGAGRYKILEGRIAEYLVIVNDVVNQKEATEVFLRTRLGNEAVRWINQQNVMDQLVTAYQVLANTDIDPKAPIVHASNAIESFLGQIATHYGVNLGNANGINSKVDKITQAGFLTDAHKFVLKYIGHVRNATDHGAIPALNPTWDISKFTAIEFVNVSLTVISSIVDLIQNNRYKL